MALAENLENDLRRFLYSKEIAPNDVMWLILGLPIKQDGKEKFLNLRIAETIVLGFGNSGIHLKTNPDGNISWSLSSLDECLWHEQSSISSIVAYEKETSLKLCPSQSEWAKERYTYEGIISVSLNRVNYERCITQIYKELNIVPRQFRVQYHVPLKHQRYHKSSFKRIYYQLHGKSTILSVRSTGPATTFEGPPKDNYDKPWIQTKKADSKGTVKSHNIEGDKGLQDSKNISKNISLKQQSSERTLLQSHPDDTETQQTNAVTSNTSPDVIKRMLKPMIPPNSVTQDIPPSSGLELLELATRVANHLGALFKKQVSHLVLDFVKNTDNQYVLIEIHGFQFSGYGPEIERKDGSLGRALYISPDLQYKIEHFYRCRLNGTKFHHHQRPTTSPGRRAGADDLSYLDSDSDDSTISSGPKNQDQSSDPNKFANIITPQTLSCRMCTRKIAPGSIRYLLTSVMLHSTVVHLRSRLPLDELPEFCRDRSMTMKSMQRLDDISSSVAPHKADVTESDLVTCEHCYALYKEESKLMEIEHKLAKFTRTAGSSSSKFDLRKKIAKPLIDSPAATTPIAQHMAPPEPVHIKRQSVSGSNILTRPLSAPLLPTATKSTSPNPIQTPTPRPTTIISRTSTLTSIQSEQSFLFEQTPPTPKSRSAKESHLRDTFRAKNSPTRTLSKEFYNTASPLKRTQSLQSEAPEKKGKNNFDGQRKIKAGNIPRDTKNGKEYPPISPIPIGRPVTRADIMSQPFTLGRMMVALHKVTDLPVIFLDAYENFRVSYVALGRRREAPCMKNFTFTRNRANRFKNRHLTRATTKIGRILEGEDESSNSETSSSHGDSLCSDPSSGYSEDEDQEKSEKSSESSGNDHDEDEGDDLYPITRRTSQVILKENEKRKLSQLNQNADLEDEEDISEICVGSLDVKYMRMSYFMIPGDAREEFNQSFNNFVNKTGKLLLVLCAKLKQNAVIDERHWTLPDESKTAKAKAQKLRSEIFAMRKKMLSKTSRSMTEVTFTDCRYDPRDDIYKVTDVGDPLPPDAIGYTYVSLSQLKCSAVKRLDVGAPLTYAIKHLPKERSVPMLRAMVGIDRPVFPMDNWSLPYSLVELQNEKNLYVAEFEDQFTSTTPLPPEWLAVEIEKNSMKRMAQPGIGGDTQPIGEVNYAEKLNSMVRAQVAADIDGHKRAPTLYVSAGRVERMTMATQQQPIARLEMTVDSEQKQERMGSSVWCLCIQVLQARHLALKSDIFAESRPVWICSYDFFGEPVCMKGEIGSDDFDEGVIYFGSTSKHLFKGSIDAVEAMFQNNPPIRIEMETVLIPPKTTSNPFGNTLAAKSLLLDIPTEANSPSNLKMLNKEKRPEERRQMTGNLGLNIQEERFVDTTVQLYPELTESNGDVAQECPLYPPYLNVNVKFFRMGPHEETLNPDNWLPPQTKLGPIISKYVTRVIPVEFGAKTTNSS